MKQKKTLDKAIEDKLKSLSHGDERVQYYNLLVGNDGNAPMYGNHQTLKNIMGTSTWRDFGILNGFGYDMQGWNSKHCDLNNLHEGIDIIVNSGSTIFAPFDCKIAEIDTDKQYIVLRKDDAEY